MSFMKQTFNCIWSNPAKIQTFAHIFVFCNECQRAHESIWHVGEKKKKYIYIYIYIYASDLDIEWINTYLVKNWGNSDICQNRLSQIKASFISITWYSVNIAVSITIVCSSSDKILRFHSTCGHNLSAIV